MLDNWERKEKVTEIEARIPQVKKKIHDGEG